MTMTTDEIREYLAANPLTPAVGVTWHDGTETPAPAEGVAEIDIDAFRAFL
ncbi:hypothetical protein N806_29670 [Rhodococcus sp. P27]|nr:hypothetical protein N806_29670 [Rhodococcus sp. P27]